MIPRGVRLASQPFHVLRTTLNPLRLVYLGIHPAAASLATAREHAERSGLNIGYRRGVGEDVPLDDSSVDMAVCVDVLEHVSAVGAVLRETARVLGPGGLYLFDTINRTRTSRLLAIKGSQEWRYTRFQPPGLHDRTHVVTPDELRRAAGSADLTIQEITGMVPRAKPPTAVRLVRQLRKGRLTYGDFGRRLRFGLDGDVRVNYIGDATKV